MHIHRLTHMHIHMKISMYAYLYIYIDIYLCINRHIHIHLHIPTRIRIHTYIHTYTYTCIHFYMSLCMPCRGNDVVFSDMVGWVSARRARERIHGRGRNELPSGSEPWVSRGGARQVGMGETEEGMHWPWWHELFQGVAWMGTHRYLSDGKIK